MHAARQRTFLFLVCATVLLGAGYAWGLSSAHDRFYAPERLLDDELKHLDFNNRVLHHVNLQQTDECRRELSARLRGQITYVQSVLPDCHEPGSRRSAEESVRHAQQVLAGQRLVAGAERRP